MHKYRLISKKGEGTFSEVLKAQSIKNGRYVAIKCMKSTFDSIDQVNNLREIQALRRLGGHPHIVKLNEVLFDEPTGRLALVFELMDMNMYESIRGRRHYLPEGKVQCHVYQLLKALDHMHRHGIFHRDVKPENLLLGADDNIKLADLGSCRGIYSRPPYTEYISTRWYRAPECLLTDGYYNFKMDIFAAGCVWFEILALFPLFPGTNELDQITKIHNVLGTPSPELLARKFKRNASHMDFNFPEKRGSGIERLIPHVSPEVTDLLKKLLEYDPDDRIIARHALKDPFFREVKEADRQRPTTGALESPKKETWEAPESRHPVPLDAASASSAGSQGHGLEPVDASDCPEDAAPAAAVGGLTSPSSSVLPALATSQKAKDSQATDVLQISLLDEEDEEEPTLLPPIQGNGALKHRTGKQSKSVKGASNSAMRSSAGNAETSGTGSHGVNGSKGFEGRHPGATQGVLGGAVQVKKAVDSSGQINPLSLGGSKSIERAPLAPGAAASSTDLTYSKKFGQSSKHSQGVQGPPFGQFSTQMQNTGSLPAPSNERRSDSNKPVPPNPKQYASPYSHKQAKR